MLKRILCVLMTALLVLSITACSRKTNKGISNSTLSSSKTFLGDDAAYGKFPSPVTVHVGQNVDSTTKFAPGETVQDNSNTRYLKQTYNINFVVDWTAASGSAYDQKVSLSIASGNIPDGLVVNNRNFMTKAASSGLLYDMTDLFKEYASTKVQAIMASSQGRAMDNASYNGKMYSIPANNVDTDGINVMWIRKDWLDKLGLPVPKTVGDVEKAAKAFIANKMAGANTIGIEGPDKNDFMYCNFLNSSNCFGGFDPIFGAMDAYPGYWLDNGNGTVSYGSISDNTNKALQVLTGWYKEGIIDPQMGTRDSNYDPVNANQAGIFFGPWWAGGYGNGDSFKNDPTANWQSYPVYTDDGKFNTHMMSTGSQYTVISKKATADVAKAILIEHNVSVGRTTPQDLGSFYEPNFSPTWPLYNNMAPTNEVIYEYGELEKVLQGKAKPSDYNKNDNVYPELAVDAQATTSGIKPPYDPLNLNISNFNMTGTSSSQFNRLYSILIGARPAATVPIAKKVYSVTYTQTTTMDTKWANLKKLEDETMLKIILGQASDTTFDQFVKDWKAQGGDQITAEVQKLLKQ